MTVGVRVPPAAVLAGTGRQPTRAFPGALSIVDGAWNSAKARDAHSHRSAHPLSGNRADRSHRGPHPHVERRLNERRAPRHLTLASPAGPFGPERALRALTATLTAATNRSQKRVQTALRKVSTHSSCRATVE